MMTRQIIKYCERYKKEVCINVQVDLVPCGNKSDEWWVDFYCNQRNCNKQKQCIHTITRNYDKDTTTLLEIYKRIQNNI